MMRSMAKYSETSSARLMTACQPLRDIFDVVVETYDCTILQGHRSKAQQNEYLNTGHSRVAWPKSRHNSKPSLAVDAAPYPIDWFDRERFVHFAGFVRGVAYAKGYIIRWGGDWDSDFDLQDQKFMDLVHFEYVRDV